MPSQTPSISTQADGLRGRSGVPKRGRQSAESVTSVVRRHAETTVGSGRHRQSATVEQAEVPSRIGRHADVTAETAYRPRAKRRAVAPSRTDTVSPTRTVSRTAGAVGGAAEMPLTRPQTLADITPLYNPGVQAPFKPT